MGQHRIENNKTMHLGKDADGKLPGNEFSMDQVSNATDLSTSLQRANGLYRSSRKF